MHHAQREPSISRRHTIEAGEADYGLTTLDREIIALVIAGCTNQESAERIGTSRRHLRQCLRTILAKLHVANRLELLLFAFDQHLTNSLLSPMRVVTLPVRASVCPASLDKRAA